MQRRDFLRLGAAGAGLALGGDFWRGAYAVPAQPGPGPYGSLDGRVPDANGLLLPEGFTSRILATANSVPVPGGTPWHVFPDGGATFPIDGGGWVYVSNSEAPAGGVGAMRFRPDGTVETTYRILVGSAQNCAGGPTPWGTWLTCEEYDFSDTAGPAGHVWECDPFNPSQGEQRPALGAFSHEAVAVDPDGRRLYLTEDQSDGRLYRFTPDAYPDLSSGALEVAAVDGDGHVTWLAVPDPTAGSGPTRRQVPDSTAFDGGEGIWFDSGEIFFTTKGDNHVRSYHVADERIEVIYAADQAGGDDAPLRGVDNIVASRSGDLFVAEDGGNLEVVLITPGPDRVVAPFLRIADQDPSATEITGPAFDPSGTRLYFSSQRAAAGTTYEVSGPFRGAVGGQEPTTTTLAAATTSTTAAGAGSGTGSSGGGSLPATGVSAGVLALGALGAGAVGWRLRRSSATRPHE